MCVVCFEYEKGKLTSKEAMDALVEMLESENDEDKVQHLFELANKIVDKDESFKEWDNDEETGFLDELDDLD